MKRLLISGIAAVAALALPAVASASGPSLGYYQCYKTEQGRNLYTNAPEDSYESSFATSFTLKTHHKYQVSFLTAENTYGQRFSVSATGSTVHFVNGAWNDDANFLHVTGMFHRYGVRMPHAQSPLNPATKYPVVLRGRAGDRDTGPPHREFTGSYPAIPTSFWYCKKR